MPVSRAPSDILKRPEGQRVFCVSEDFIAICHDDFDCAGILSVLYFWARIRGPKLHCSYSQISQASLGLLSERSIKRKMPILRTKLGFVIQSAERCKRPWIHIQLAAIQKAIDSAFFVLASPVENHAEANAFRGQMAPQNDLLRGQIAPQTTVSGAKWHQLQEVEVLKPDQSAKAPPDRVENPADEKAKSKPSADELATLELLLTQTFGPQIAVSISTAAASLPPLCRLVEHYQLNQNQLGAAAYRVANDLQRGKHLLRVHNPWGYAIKCVKNQLDREYGQKSKMGTVGEVPVYGEHPPRFPADTERRGGMRPVGQIMQKFAT